MSKEVAEEYLSSLADLTVNSKPLINMLTMLADENVDHAPAIVQVIENHLEKVPADVKLPILYLIDSIIKNVSKVYVPLFTQNIVNVFVSVFEKVDERTRLNMYKLRQTWADVFPARKLYVLDLRVKDIDHAWPVTAPTPTSIHFNPKFLGNKPSSESSSATTPPQTSSPATGTTTTSSTELPESVLREQLLKKQQILIELQQKKLELQLMQTKAIIEGQENQQGDANGQTILNNLVRPPLNEEAAKLFSQRATLKPKAVVMPPSTSSPKLGVLNPNKTKIAPANTQLIKAAKSRDPRLVRQQQQQQSKVSSEVCHKEQEIYNRQMAMLKTPLLEQVTPVVPAQKVLGDCNVKSHITFNVQGNPEKGRLETKNKKQFKEGMTNDNAKNKSKPPSSKDFKGSPSKGSKTVSTKGSKTLSARERRNLSRLKTPPRNERSVSPGNRRSDSPLKDVRWPKDSYRHSRSHSTKSSKPNSNRSGSPSKGEQNSMEIFTPEGQYSPERCDLSKKSHRKSKKKHRRGENHEKDTGSQKKDMDENSSCKKRVGERIHEPIPIIVNLTDKEDSSPVPGSHYENKAVSKEDADNSEYNRKNKNISDHKKETKMEKNKLKHREKSGTLFFDENEKPDKVVSLDLELIDSSPSPEPPPPPVISKTDDVSSNEKKGEIDFDEISEDEKEIRNEVTGFKDIKGVPKGRNYMRRNRELSASPSKDIGIDVDLRKTGPPEKQPKLLYEEDKTTVVESKKLLSESLVSVSGKDVDLRLLTIRGGSPSKKRLSTETKVEEPPKKKNKSEIFDELFGTEDVDLRKITRGSLSSGDRLPSPPPPPVISNGAAVPQIAAIAPLVVGDKSLLGDDFQRENLLPESDIREREGFDRARLNRRTWTDIKGKPEGEIKPLKLSTQLELEIDSRKDNMFSPFDPPDKGNKKHFKDRSSPRGELDRLGRPLLYNKLPNDPRARRESLGVLDGRDTDLRRLEGLMDREYDTNINVNMIITQAGDQVRNGTMTVQEYNELLKQVIHVNEKQKLREAQNKSRQEIRKSQYHHRNRRSPNRFGSQNRKSPPIRVDDDRRERRPFNDIDERLQIPWRNIQQNESVTSFGRLPFQCAVNRNPFDMSEYDDHQKKSEVWEEDSNCFRNIDELDKTENRIRDVMCNERTHDCVDVPPADPLVLEMIAKDPMKSINIDGTARDIRFFGDTAIVMLSWDDPKEISFEDGMRRVAIGDLSIACALNHSYIVFMLNGNPHRIRLGAPTRELYIDGEFYEAHFGGPPVQINIDGLPYLVQLEGPPPQVKIGKRRMDLICGRVNMIVDATAMLPLYLDAKPQRFDLKSRPYIFRIVNNLKTLLVNEVPVDIQFGGGCRQICGYGNLHFLRLSVLPNGVEPGRVRIVNMENLAMPPINSMSSGKCSPPINTVNQQSNATEQSIASSDVTQQPSVRAVGASLDILTSLMSGVPAPEQSVGFNYQVESQDTQVKQPSTVRQEAETTTAQTQATSIPLLGSGININDLFQRLVASGIVPTLSNTIGNVPKSQPDIQVKPMDFSDINLLRERQPTIINSLYSGIQCSSCGVRFSPEETVKYSRHLDWHFRQNRREKDAARKGQSRKWYYDVSDWIQFEEIEDLEERAQSWFEAEATSNGDDNNEQEELKSVPAPSGQGVTMCELCRDEFETYYNEEKEEWHLRPCIIVENKYYHPLCHEDLSNIPDDSLIVDKTVESNIAVKGDMQEESTVILENTEEEEEIREKEKNEDEDLRREQEDNLNREDFVLKEVELENRVPFNIENNENEQEECDEHVIKHLLNELINCIVFKNEMDLSQEFMPAEVIEPDNPEENDHEEEIEVLESVPVEAKKNIIDVVNLVEKLDDEEEIIYQRRPPSPIVLIPPAKIKQEPVDEMEAPVAVVDQTYTSVVSSIDGNVEMIDTPQVAQPAPSRIKITFNKPISTDQHTEKQIVKQVPVTPVEEIDPDPLPLKPKKPRIAEREMTVYLPCVRGTEVSGLCSIM